MAVVEALDAAPGDRRRLRLRSPATLELLGEIEVQAADDARGAVERARKAQPAWAALGFRGRARVMERAVRALVSRQAECVRTLVRETGKPATEALAVEVLPACDALTFYAKRAGDLLGDRRLPLHLLRTKRLRISHRPLGVVGIITPWNFPFLLAANPVAQALMAGNAVVLKPSAAAPFSAQLLEDLFVEAGLPEGLFQLVLGDGETGAALVESGIDKLAFTGSVRTGRCVAQACARRLLPCTLELGGKDPMIVCADADLERAASGAVYGAFANAGQVSVSVERLYVVDEVADEFVRRVVEKTAALRQGVEGEFDVGPMITAEQLAVVERQVDEARTRGARVLAGGRRNPEWPGLFYEPTVLVDVTPEMTVLREETFGPVLPIVRVRDEEEAVRLANQSPYGLNGSVWTRDRRRGERLARALESGGAVVNDCLLSYGVTESPFGGRKHSGIGQLNGEAGLRAFSHAQPVLAGRVLVDRWGARSEFLWYPYTAGKRRRIERALRLAWGTSLGRWLS